MTPHADHGVAIDTAARAVRCAVWLGLLEAQRAQWPDVVASLYEAHATAAARVRDREYHQWRAQLEIEGPHQCKADDEP